MIGMGNEPTALEQGSQPLKFLINSFLAGDQSAFIEVPANGYTLAELIGNFISISVRCLYREHYVDSAL